MLDFRLPEESRLLREAAEAFARREILPRAAELDRTGTFPEDLFARAAEAGWICPTVPEAYGGAGASQLEAALIAEAFAWACAGVASSLLVGGLVAGALLLRGSEAQKKRWLPELVRHPAAYCVTEPGAGSDVAALRTRAVRIDGGYRIDGTKTLITNGSVARLYLVLAVTAPERGRRGMSFFLVERDRPGVRPGRPFEKLGLRASDTAEVHFDGVEVPEDHRIGEEGEGFPLAMAVFNGSRPLVGAMAVGVARRAWEEARAYARERQAFGRPLTGHQAIAHLLADLWVRIEAARLLVWKAAWSADRGHPDPTLAAAAKLFAARTAQEVTHQALQVLGGYGYLEEYPLAKLYRDARIFQIYEGTDQIQLEILARRLL